MPNPNYQHTITIYNRLPAAASGSRTDTWRRTVLTGCFFKAETQISNNGTVATQSNTYTVRIPESDRYLPRDKWCQAANRGKRWTVSEDDIVVFGKVTDEISGAFSAVDLLNKYRPDAFRVKAFSDNTRYRYLKHYRLGG